jgi:hypothetical protein
MSEQLVCGRYRLSRRKQVVEEQYFDIGPGELNSELLTYPL